MSNQLKAEWFKLQRNRTFWVLVLTITGLSALLHYLVIIDWWQMYNTPFESAGLNELNAMSTFTVPLYFNLLVSTLAGFYISNEFSQTSVIKNQIISGSKRSHIFLSKYVIFTLGSIVMTILIPLLTALIEVILLGHGEILNLSGMLYLGRSIGLFTLHILSYTGIILLLAMITEDSGKTIILSIIFTFVMDVIRLLPKSQSINTLYEFTIFHQFSEVFKVSMTTGEILKSIIIAFVTLIIIILCGMFVFNRKEIK